MPEQFDTPRARDAGLDEVERDRWGRYLLPHPDTGSKTAWTRSTTFAKSISDTFALSQWGNRMVLKGAALRPDLTALASTLDVKADKKRLDQLVEDAKSAAGNKVAANLGTARHSITEMVDQGMPLSDVPLEARPDVSAYMAVMKSSGLRVVPGMIERQVVVPAFEVGGTFDRLLDLNMISPSFARALDADILPGSDTVSHECVGDVKTGQDLQYGWNEIAIQLLLYALGVRTAGVWNRETRSWEPPRPVRLDFAIVMHMPVGQKECTLYKLDLRDAMWALDLCRDVRRWRKMRVLATPLERAVADSEGFTVRDNGVGDAGPVQVSGLSWLERFQVAGSRGELSALFAEANEAGVWSDVLRDAGMARLKVLEEKAG